MAYNFLIVDDSHIVRMMIRKTIGMTDIKVGELLEAEHGLQAFEVLKTQWVDLLFLDINMPVMNGIEFLEKLRTTEEYKDLPVVVVSTEGATERIQRLEAMGIKAYLRKPVTPESLAGTIASVLGGQ